MNVHPSPMCRAPHRRLEGTCTTGSGEDVWVLCVCSGFPNRTKYNIKSICVDLKESFHLANENQPFSFLLLLPHPKGRSKS